MKSYKSFSQISNQLSGISNFFNDKTEYLAHTHPTKELETLHEHIICVSKYFLRLIQLHGLEPIIDKCVNTVSFRSGHLGDFIKELFYLSMVFHDFGKTNPNFQRHRMNNSLFEENSDIKIGYQHSFASAYFFVNYNVDKISRNSFSNSERNFAYILTFLFSIPIIKHHSGYLSKDYTFSEEKINGIHYLTEMLNLDISKDRLRKLLDYESSGDERSLWAAFDIIMKKQELNLFSLFTLLKLNYSLLTASDYLATNEYMSDMQWQTEEDFGLITKELKKRLIFSFDNNNEKKYNGELVLNPNKFLSKSLNELEEKSFENLNLIRQKLGAEIVVNIEKYKDEKVFYIEAPTGGGKTNMSMLAIRKLLELQPEITKIFYVFPFTTLVTQTAAAIKGTFDLKDYEVTQVHSKASYQEKRYVKEEEDADNIYGKEKRNQIDNLFVNYPFTLLTHIKLFDILKSNKKDTNYLLHRLANSIVVIDELQAYNPEHWDKIKYFIANYADLFNIRFIIMSATLPKIDRIQLSNYKPKEFISLIPNAKMYLQNSNFAGRVTINTDLLSFAIELSTLANLVFEKSKIFAEKRTDKHRNSIYTIVEFIFKKSASEFYEIVSTMEKFFDRIFVLSGTILEPRRRYIIEYLKDSENRKKKILLITTQVVEAGVDIDMDLGFKSRSIVDSDEQLAGRINRNVRKRDCVLYLFNQKGTTPKSIYGNDLRYQVAQKLPPTFVKDILTNKEFEKLYDKVFSEIEKINKSAYKQGLSEYLDNFKRMDFKNIHQNFKLIESNNASIFVPVNISIDCYGSIKNFSDNEIKFIEQHRLLTNGKVSGEIVWTFYQGLINNKDMGFAIKSYSIKMLNGIMSKFVFSIFLDRVKDLDRFIENSPIGSDHQFQTFLKFRKKGLSNIYSTEGGINQTYLESITKNSYEFI